MIGEPGDATTHLENRAGEPTANSYLYMTSQIISGRDGVEKKIEPPPLSEEPYSEDMPPLPGNEALTGCRIHLLQRIDTVVDRLLEEGLGLEELVRRFEETMEQRRSEGWKGLMTIVAYRTGLAVDPDAGEREAAESLKQTGPIRRRAKPLRDFLLRRALGLRRRVRPPIPVPHRLLRLVELAPAAKVLAATDGFGIPETYWFAATLTQEAWTEVEGRLEKLGVDQDWLGTTTRMVFEENARRLYKL